jgi:hypothetical protein
LIAKYELPVAENKNIKIFADSFDEGKNFETIYSGWPERGYVIDKDLNVQHISYGNVDDMVRWSEEIDHWLISNL